jgi:sulfate permease, SulP family
MPKHLTFRPKIFKYLKGYNLDIFVSDLVAGLVVGIVALPLAIAFGIASGVSPEKGLVTAVVAGFLISALGGSRVQIGGPTGAFIVVVYGVVQQHGLDGLTVATLMAGCFLIVMGLTGLGGAIRFVPHSVVAGFTGGIAVIIFSSQVNDMLGLGIRGLPADFLEKWKAYFEHSGSVSVPSLVICALTAAMILLWSRFAKRIPGSLVAIALFSTVVALFQLPVETIGARFGDLPHTLPAPRWPVFDLTTTGLLIQPAVTIAFLAGIESLLSARVADRMTQGKHRSNTELIAQGIANISSAMFGGIPATGAIARTATNIKNGARTPIAGIIHALVLLATLFFFGRWARLIPLACLAGVLVVVSYHMSEWRLFLSILQGPAPEAAVLMATFLLTIFTDLTVAIALGTALSAILYWLNRSSNLKRA